MRIAYVINNTWFPGGQTRVLANKVNYWLRNGHEVYILTSDQIGKESYYAMDSRVKIIDYAIGYMGADQLSKLEKAKRLSRFLIRHKRLLKKSLLELRPDACISMFGKEIYFLPFLKDGSVKVLEAHGARYTWLFSRKGILGKVHNWIDLFFIRKFDQFVVLTNEDLPTWGVNNTVCIPNANTFMPQTTSSLDVPKVIASGRYGEQKNFESLVEAWNIVHKSYPGWSLKICGQGLSLLDPLIQSLNLSDSIDCHESNNMEAEYMDSSISVVSSRHEGFSMALLEAQSCGVPNVSYACQCGPRDIIVNGETGFLIEEVGNHEKLAEAIMHLIEDEQLRKQMGRSSRERSKLFSEDVVMKRWYDLFAELVKRKKG